MKVTGKQANTWRSFQVEGAMVEGVERQSVNLDAQGSHFSGHECLCSFCVCFAIVRLSITQCQV